MFDEALSPSTSAVNALPLQACPFVTYILIKPTDVLGHTLSWVV